MSRCTVMYLHLRFRVTQSPLTPTNLGGHTGTALAFEHSVPTCLLYRSTPRIGHRDAFSSPDILVSYYRRSTANVPPSSRPLLEN